MKKEELFEILGDIDPAYVQGARRINGDRKTGSRQDRKRDGKTDWRRRGAVFAAACLILAAAGLRIWDNSRRWELSGASWGVTVRDAGKVSESSAACLVWFSEEELFSRFDTVVFAGTIRSIRNIEIDFNGIREYRAVAEIAAEKVYRGSLEEQEVLTVLVPCSIGSGHYATGTDTVSVMEMGMKGIFMPMVYDDASVWEENGAALALKDVADYGFADGSRYAFLETGEGIVFDRGAYGSIADAQTLGEVEAYVMRMLGGDGAGPERN